MVTWLLITSHSLSLRGARRGPEDVLLANPPNIPLTRELIELYEGKRKKSCELINHFKMKAIEVFMEIAIHFHAQVCFLPFTSSLLGLKSEKADAF